MSLRLATQLSGEIISCDSMQVYRGMDIGTAKPTLIDQKDVRHHLIDILDITEPYDASRFVQDAETAIADIEGRGRRPIIAGGTGLYAKALIYGFQMLPADPALFSELQQQADQPGGLEALRKELTPTVSDGTIPLDVAQNPRRILRAVEVLRLTGMPPWQHHRTPQAPRKGFQQVILFPGNALLRSRIAQRTQIMLDHGWIEETERLLANGLLSTPTAYQALGYADIAEYLAGNRNSTERDELRERIISRTMHFARRQKSWFKNQHPGAHILPIEDHNTTAEDLVMQILAIIGSTP